MALTSFLTGVTEPIEFTFVFLAPVLYAVHAVLTGTAMVLMDALGVRLGFGFSAGLFDYLLNYGKATQPLLMLPVGALYFAVYYGAFRFVIARFNLKTPGRDDDDLPATALAAAPSGETGPSADFIAALGGAANIREVDACMTRLRVSIASPHAVDEQALRRLGARGMVRLSDNSIQVVVGPVADQLAGAIRRSLRAEPAGAGAAADPSRVLAALGGPGNVRTVETASTRLLIGVRDDAAVDEQMLLATGIRAIARPARGSVHVLIGPQAAPAGEALKRLLALPPRG
jgi:PTS system N-acetylglucosamine-specific IIC component